ncbi:Rqc2 family fibronectin-binding protein [Natronospora cellulosivora (SeqCode)]
MSIDGIMLAAINKELNDTLIEGRIDKIYQVNKHLVTILIRNNNFNYKLLMSSHPVFSRIHISTSSFKNPIKAPDFCMLLRKYLMRGIIKKIEQPDFERIINIEVSIYNKLYNLIIEIMGKHSNISLIDQDGIVLDSIKRVSSQISRERQLYPGIKYKYPPRQDKLNPLIVSQDNYFEKIPDDFQQAAHRAIMFNFRGIGPYSAKEIVYRANIDPTTPYNQLSKKEKFNIWNKFNEIFTNINQGNFQPSLGIKNNNIKYISAFPLKHRKEDNILYKNTGELFDFYYQNEILDKTLNQYKHKLNDISNTYLKKNLIKQEKLKSKLKVGENADEFKKIGELITANLYQIKRGMTELDVIDFYHPEQKNISLKLDPKISPSKNAQKYYKKYSKAKKSITYLKKQIAILRHEEKYLEQVLLNIEQAESEEELKEIKEELIKEGYIKENKKNKKEKKKNKALAPHKFRSSDGFDILVGRNNHQNDYLTKKLANKEDIWLHVKDLAGSHTIIRNHTRDEIPLETIKEAAIIAAYYSKARLSENVPIDYTEIKNVNKPKGAKPGLVYYEDYQTVFATPKKKLIDKLKQ